MNAAGGVGGPAGHAAPADRPQTEPAAAAPAHATPGQTAEPSIVRGVCHVCFAADLGFSIDLEQAARRTPGDGARPVIRERRTPSHISIEPPPLQMSVTAPPLRFGAFALSPHATLTVFDFGGVAATYRIPLHGPLSGLVDLSERLYENQEITALAREHLAALFAQLGSAIHRPDAFSALEDFAIFQVQALDPPTSPEALLRSHRATLAAILRSESGPLAPSEIEEATRHSISYRPHDLLVVDWNAAFALDDDFDALAAVLSFANVELLELRVLDGMLDGLVNRAYEMLAHRSFRDVLGIGPGRQELRRVARLQMDSAVVFEQVNNAFKLFGDEYLARVYRLASHRLHLADWDASVLRKLQTVEQIYTKVSDAQANRRIEVLEWIIILLIAWEVVWAFFR